MSEETQVANTSANAENSTASATSSEQINSAQAQPQAEANSASEQNKEASTPFHEHPRFKEIINEKNELKNRLSEMERLLQDKLEPKGPTPYELSKQDFVGLGIQEAAADKMLKAIDRMVEARTEARVRPLEAKTVQADMDRWTSDFARTHEDFNKLEPKMTETFKSLPPETQMSIVSDPKGLELLYAHVKQQDVKSEIDAAYQRGIQDGYKGKSSKSSVTPGLSGSANPPGELTPESIGRMTNAEYKKRRDEIWAALNDGTIKA